MEQDEHGRPRLTFMLRDATALDDLTHVFASLLATKDEAAQQARPDAQDYNEPARSRLVWHRPPFAGDEVLRQYLRDGDYSKLRRRLEADAKSLFALYQYSCLHGAVRLRWGFLDEMVPAPWFHSDEPTLHTLMRRAHELDVPLEIVAGSAPGRADPWSRVQRVHVEKDKTGWPLWLVSESGYMIDTDEVQLARWAAPDREAI